MSHPKAVPAPGCKNCKALFDALQEAWDIILSMKEGESGPLPPLSLSCGGTLLDEKRPESGSEDTPV